MAIICDVCGGELMVGAGGKTAKCTVCGIGYSIERIREMINDTQEKSEKKYLLFSAKNMNWGQISLAEGTWRSTEYKVYSNGTIWSKADFQHENPDSFWGKLSQPVEEKMKRELFQELKQILTREFDAAAAGRGCDGEGWEMISYEKDGSQWHKIAGYICGVPVLEKIEKILKEAGQKEPAQDPIRESEEIVCVDYEIVDFEIVGDKRESTIPSAKKTKSLICAVNSEEVSREEDFVFRTEFNEEVHDDDEILVEYTGKAATIIIPEKTDVLGEVEGEKSVFRYPETVKKIIISKYVRGIGDYAFCGCKNLEEIHIPEGVIYLWYSCGELEYTEDGLALNDCSHIFEGCTGLKKVVFDKNAWQGEDICDTLFKGCSSLKHVELPETIQWIGRYMFEDCVELEEIVIPDSVNTIGQYAFKGCRKLKNVVLPNHPVAIHPTAFMGTGFIPPRHYTTGFNVNRCCVCGGKLNLWSQCKKCNRQIIYCGDKKDWK